MRRGMKCHKRNLFTCQPGMAVVMQPMTRLTLSTINVGWHVGITRNCLCSLTLLLLQIEARFRFLAADSTATIRGKRPSYREALLLIRDR
jgi:hypothetical protein